MWHSIFFGSFRLQQFLNPQTPHRNPPSPRHYSLQRSVKLQLSRRARRHYWVYYLSWDSADRSDRYEQPTIPSKLSNQNTPPYQIQEYDWRGLLNKLSWLAILKNISLPISEWTALAESCRTAIIHSFEITNDGALPVALWQDIVQPLVFMLFFHLFSPKLQYLDYWRVAFTSSFLEHPSNARILILPIPAAPVPYIHCLRFSEIYTYFTASTDCLFSVKDVTDNHIPMWT